MGGGMAVSSELNGDELESGFLIFDCPDESGLEFHIPVGSMDSNMSARFFMSDEQAEHLIEIIQNKLNARRP